MSNPDPNSVEQNPPQKKPEFIKAYEEPLPSAISQRQWAVLIVAGFLILAGLGYRFFSRGDIKLVSPLNQAAVSAAELSFNWQCAKEGVSFVIEVYDSEGNIVMRQITDQQSYKPAINQQAAFQANSKYQWFIIPNPDVEQKYRLNKSESRTFQITQAVTMPEATPAPTPSPSPSPVQRPKPNDLNIPTHD